MTRASIVASALAAIVAGVFSLQACARTADQPAAETTPPANIRLAQVPLKPAGIGPWIAGTNYTVLEAAQETGAGPGKVEIVEVFWYGCGHCYALDPTLESWKTSKPAYVEFVRVPVIWGPTHRQHAKLYYTIQALKRPDLHSKIFDAIHRGGKMLAAQNEDEVRALHWEFLKDHGVSQKDFDAAYDSPAVKDNVRKAQNYTEQYSIASVPVMIVNGKYATGVGPAGGADELIRLVNDLAASEKPR